jgi:hypothetical protein
MGQETIEWAAGAAVRAGAGAGAGAGGRGGAAEGGKKKLALENGAAAAVVEWRLFCLQILAAVTMLYRYCY